MTDPKTPDAEELARQRGAYRRGMLRAAEIAQGYPDTDQGMTHASGPACCDGSENIAAAIRAAAGEEQSHDR